MVPKKNSLWVVQKLASSVRRGTEETGRMKQMRKKRKGRKGWEERKTKVDRRACRNKNWVVITK